MSDLNTSLPVWNKADALVRLMNNESLLQRVAALFFKTAPAQMENLKTSIAAADLETASREAHTLKGASGNIGAEQMMDVCARMEQAANGGDTQTLTALCPAMDAAFAALQQEAQL